MPDKSKVKCNTEGNPQLLAEVLDSIGDGITVLNREWNFIYINERAAANAGFKPKDLIGQNLWDKFPLMSGTDYEVYYRKAMVEQKPQYFEIEDSMVDRLYAITVYPLSAGIAIHWKDITERKKAEEGLQQSEQRYRNLVEVTSDFIWEVNKKGLYTYVSPKIYEVLGYKPEEVVGKTPFEMMTPEEGERVRKIFFRYVSQKSPVNSLENINLHKDGHPVVLETSGVPVYDSDGRFQGYRGIDRDITRRKKAEEEVRKAHEEAEKRAQEVSTERQRLFNVLETLPTIICLFTPDYHIKFANRLFREIYGEPGDHFCYEYFGFSEPCKFCETHQVLKTGKPHHWEINAPDGKILNAYDFPFTDTDGSPLILEMDIDVTERRKAEEALVKANDELELRVQESTSELRQSEDKFRRIFETANEAIWIVDLQTKIIMANDQVSETLGYPLEEIIGRSINDFLIKEQERSIVGKMRKALNKGTTLTYERRLRHKNGSTIYLLVNSSPLLDSEGRHMANIGMMANITQRKKVEIALSEAKTELEKANQQLKAYGQRITQVQEEERKRIAYELHDDTAQYISILKMQIGALIQSKKIRSPDVLEKLKYLEKDADRAFHDVRRYSHELRPVVLEHMGLLAALEQIVEDINKLNPFKVEVNVRGREPELSEEVKLGFFRIAQEALNNIRKHAKANNVIINLSFQKKHLSMMVIDDGTGFEIKQSNARAGDKGSLGLVSMRERADLIGANLKIESKPGKGTIVRVEISL